MGELYQNGKIKPSKKYLKKLIKIESKIDIEITDEIKEDIWMLKQYCRIIEKPSSKTRSNLLLENIAFFSKEGIKQVVLTHNGHITELKAKFQNEAVTFCTISANGNYIAKDDKNNLTESKLESPYSGTFEYYLNQEFSEPTILFNSPDLGAITRQMWERNIGSTIPDMEFIYKSDDLELNNYILYFPETTPSQIYK